MKKRLPLIVILFAFASPFTVTLCHAQTAVLWGVAEFGGTYSNGIILNYNITTTTEKDLYNFGNSPDGEDPEGSLIKATNGLLYGMTYSSGAYSGGVIFSYNISTGVESVLHSFGNGTDGKLPYGSLIQASDTLLYGTTYEGGINNEGILFSYNIKTGIETDLHDFGSGNDGGYPSATLIQANNGLLYGTTQLRGTNYAAGTIFKFDIKTGIETTIHNFGTGTDGSQATCSLLQATNGLLYGMTEIGGTNSRGTIFSCDTLGSETDLHDFDSTDGQNPYEGLIQVNDSLLYGMTRIGGSKNVGVLISYNINSHKETVLHNFGIGTDGSYPRGKLLLGSNGLLYGMTTNGGSNAAGTIFNYNITLGTETIIHNFPYLATTDGAYPTGGLIEIDSSEFIAVPSTASICNGDSIVLTSSGETTYTWMPSAGLSATTGDTVIATPAVTTTYTITGNATNTITVVVTVNPNPPVTTGSPQSICQGDSAILTANGAVTYTWAPSTGLNATTGSSVVAAPVVPTTYTVTGTSALGCTAQSTESVGVGTGPNKPAISISVTGDTLFSSSQSGNQWYRNDTLIKGATDSFYVITGLPTDTFKVSVTDQANGCSTTSDSVVVTSGIEHVLIGDNQLSIYPNPVVNNLCIKINPSAGDVKDWSLQIIDILGRTVYSNKSSLSYNNAIDLSDFSGGVYFIVVVNKTGRVVAQVVKQN